MQQHTQPEKNNDEESIFVSRPLPVEPPHKKSILFIVSMTLLGVAILFAVFLATLYTSASSAAHNFTSLSYQQVKKVNAPISDLSPQLILDNRDTNSPLLKVGAVVQAQPSLANVLFVGGLNPEYKNANELQTRINNHYDQILVYAHDMSKVLAFEDKMEVIIGEDTKIEAEFQPTDSLSVRSVSGTYRNIASQIAKLPVPTELRPTQKSIVSSYNKRAQLYEDWAKNIESGNNSSIESNKAFIQKEKDKVRVVVSDESFAKLFKQKYMNITTTQKSLLSALANS